MDYAIVVSPAICRKPMIKIVFLFTDGNRLPVTIEAGRTVMDAALDHNIPGIKAQCGGGCTCCTCHCYVAAQWVATFGSPSQDEQDLLEYAWQPRPGSRLSCQLRLTAAHDGLVIEVPAQQA